MTAGSERVAVKVVTVHIEGVASEALCGTRQFTVMVSRSMLETAREEFMRARICKNCERVMRAGNEHAKD